MLNLTREEKVVLVFLTASFLLGSGVNFYRKKVNVIASLTEFTLSKSEGFARNDSKKTNINNAAFNELVKIKGIGPKTAIRIMLYREKNGPFFYKEDLMKIKGIGRAKFDIIKDDVVAE